ncbi:AAA family ATPase [Leptolyngbya sp. FACHB-8]|uniref:AAA family ATPase n=1 Tax=unclassified Leptolyngbya TaxID=2650499 RepID=UPI001685EA0A|nr:AAA family ATPase [Leptolyngbya sp. FACHB-8]MBD1912029.1 AAA family ATPase [Leptolyngbya sp. FACHB-8]
MSYYISPHFLEKLSVHITKNYLKLPGVRVPLILGVHGRKGEGKTFMCELVYERMGIEAIHVSAGELESPDAGDPARLIRLRYREAAELVKVRGRMAVLMINDVDAGIGRVDSQTQYTVNTQLVNATLMNIADNPTNVQLPGSYDAEPVQRIPIILTGNDFSTLYAPLVRDGRMEKFFWDPDRSDRLGIIGGIFDKDLSPGEVETLVDTFPNQAIDFFSALRAQLYDEQVRNLIQTIGLEHISQKVVHSDGKPTEFHRPDFSLPHLIEIGRRMVREQERIRELRLVEEYHSALQPRMDGGGQRADGQGSVADKQAVDGKKRPIEERNSAPASPPKPIAHYPSTDHNGSNDAIPAEAIAELERLLNTNHRIGIEHVNERRFRIGSWQCYGSFESTLDVAIAGLKACMAEYPQDYIRLVGVSPDRRRVAELIVQRPKAAV